MKTGKQQRLEDRKYYVQKRKETKKLLERLLCTNPSSFSDLKKNNFLIALGCSNFYIVDSNNEGLLYDSAKNAITFNYISVIHNIHVSKINNSTGTNKFVYMTKTTKRYNSQNEKVGKFKLNKDIYCAPYTLKEFIIKLVYSSEKKSKQEETNTTNENRKYA